ncbi:hypothetical protein DSO57_1023173 [Entomophthora muscae]|uniref:Uncharacterized protein n=1 Tax=Entomophthora muscae TaxID=34485 RepID=A0ACC2SFZ7_9FUNG|nr:hypothetical protein DSO57_1023173 [Entomophthora muscae]
MQHCGFCKGPLQSTPVFKHQVKKPEQLRDESTDVRSIITKCGHTFHYVCLVRDKFQENGLVDCFSCHKRTRLSDTIIVDSSNEATDSGDTAAQASGVKRSSPCNIAQQRNKQSFNSPHNFNQSKNFLFRGINPSHIFKTIALGILLALVFVYVSGGLLGDTSVDVSENSQGLLGSSLLRLKKTAAAMNGIKADFFQRKLPGKLDLVLGDLERGVE